MLVLLRVGELKLLEICWLQHSDRIGATSTFKHCHNRDYDRSGHHPICRPFVDCRFRTTFAVSIKLHRYESFAPWLKHLQILKLLAIFW